MTDQPEFPRNHNLQALPLDEQAKLAIDEALAEPRQRWAQLKASYERAPAEIADEDTAGKVTTLIAQMGACDAAIGRAHAGAKAPYLDAGRIVDGVANKIGGELGEAKQDLEARLAAYQSAKRKRIQEERAAKRESYDAIGDPEPSWVDPRQRDRAKATVRSDEGASAHLTDDISVEIVDVKKIPVRYLKRPKVLAALAAEIKPDAKKGDEIKGIVIHQVEKSRVRRG